MTYPPSSILHPLSSVLVTGGAGFIGSHLVDRLLSDGHTVSVIDDLSTGSLENLAAARRHPRFRFIQSRLSACAELPSLLSECDYIFHLAAAVGVDLVVKSPVRVLETNLHQTEVLLEAAVAHRVPVLLTSTSEVYGKSTKDSFSEEDDLLIGPPTHSRWSYACSKLMDEFLALAYHRDAELPVVIVRLFNTVGPRQTGAFGMVLPRFVACALRNEPLQVYGDGQQTRCFCAVADTVEALVRLRSCPEAVGQIYNVGGNDEISMLELARRVIAATESQSAIQHVPYETAYAPGFEDMRRRRPCVDKLSSAVGFRPATPLGDIIDAVTREIKKAPRRAP